ncbi:protein disulfide isomerase, putative [Perkinsus marinus ATCC 50983]|uniref:Protein disulfide-isomerase n=1 Tax=Perkinsus marinus (strain ATCC 50983 / TXsc) TaxID=423536 RepID=C5K529_PERM5|nr:protein disulfide isomerase, putative [Perkinsus marinus ATCC 50983]EER20451.1 protein disulfide isomerase, putative [Perkinsus marinus ATCC 50983]|eukprot:XP_002788655.1 protein disulfide isomerase, putative [Perkinsus marinus ATCC 50983]
MARFITFFAAVAAVAAAAESESKVHQLTDDNLEDFVKNHKYALVKFYAPWCGHCKKIAPEFEQAAKELAEEVGEEKLALGELDATEHKKMAEKYGVRGYPTLYWFVDGEHSEYGGGRTAADIKSWCVDMTGPAVKKIDSRKLAEEQAETKPICVYEGREASSDFEEVAASKRSEFTFYHVATESDKPKVTVQHKGEEAVVCDDISVDGLKKCLKDNTLPLFGVLDGESYGKYMSAGKGLVWGCFELESSEDLEKVADEHRPIMNELAKEFQEQFAFTYIDTVQFKSAIEGMLGVTEFPTLAVNKKAGDKMKYLYTGEMTKAKIAEFLKGVLDGTVEPTLKSEPVPSSQDEPVHVVVGSTLEKDLFQADKDVLFEVYAPWCGHCKQLAPEYEKVAKKVAKEGVDDMIVIAKMDGTANDSPIESITWDGFPTLYYIKAGESEPVKYDGPREAKGIWKWIKKHHSNAEALKERLAASRATEKEEEEDSKGEKDEEL